MGQGEEQAPAASAAPAQPGCFLLRFAHRCCCPAVLQARTPRNQPLHASATLPLVCTRADCHMHFLLLPPAPTHPTPGGCPSWWAWWTPTPCPSTSPARCCSCTKVRGRGLMTGVGEAPGAHRRRGPAAPHATVPLCAAPCRCPATCRCIWPPSMHVPPASPLAPPPGLKVIRKKLVRKAIDMIKKLADGSAKAQAKLEEAEKGGCSAGAACTTVSKAGQRKAPCPAPLPPCTLLPAAAQTRRPAPPVPPPLLLLLLQRRRRARSCPRSRRARRASWRRTPRRWVLGGYPLRCPRCGCCPSAQPGRRLGRQVAGWLAHAVSSHALLKRALLPLLYFLLPCFPPQYEKFWGSFGKSLKMGLIEDPSNRCAARLAGGTVNRLQCWLDVNVRLEHAG